ncbi:unnamed protein product, partial [Ectocarpus fasciculatus]
MDMARGIGGGDGVESDGDVGSGNTAKRKRGKHRRDSSGDGGGGGGLPRLSSPPASPNADVDNDNGLSEPRFAATNDDDDDNDDNDDDDDMEIEEDDDEEEEAKEVKPSRHSAPPPHGGGGGGGRPLTPPPEMEGMTRVAPKPGKAGRVAKSENFVINEPGREPFYVHAFHGGGPEHCVDLQARLPRNLDVDGRVSMTNLNGTMKSRAGASIRVLVLRPGGGGPNNPNVLNRFCQEFTAYKNQGRAGYCFKQFDKKHVEFLYLVPPALAPQVPLLAQNPAAQGHLVCLVITVASAVVPPPAPVMLPPQPPPQQQQQQQPPQTQYLYRPPPPTFTPSAPAQQQPPTPT